jgi:hypothetical protein
MPTGRHIEKTWCEVSFACGFFRMLISSHLQQDARFMVVFDVARIVLAFDFSLKFKTALLAPKGDVELSIGRVQVRMHLCIELLITQLVLDSRSIEFLNWFYPHRRMF